jgi:hypothetical protein
MALVLAPLGVVTVTATFPFIPAGDTAVIEPAEFTVKLIALVEPNLTAVTPVKFVPLMFTGVPPATGPLWGAILLIAGGGPGDT